MNIQEYLDNLCRVSSVNEGLAKLGEETLLLPEGIALRAFDDSNVQTVGLSTKSDSQRRDILRIIQITDAFNVQYTETNILSPLVYVHSLETKPCHITTQAVLFTHISEMTKGWVEFNIEQTRCHYGRHQNDCLWLPFSKKLDDVSTNDLVCIFNRRVGGWDGSIESPVIELLGAGGHLQSVWDEKSQCFKSRTIFDNLAKEFREEIGLDLRADEVKVIGGFSNDSTSELVILCGVMIAEDKLPALLEYAINNIEEETDGLYLGTFDEVIEFYRIDPRPFAGGMVAAPYNFPNRPELIQEIRDIVK